MKKFYALMLMLIISAFTTHSTYAQTPTSWDGTSTSVTIEDDTSKSLYKFTAPTAGSYTFVCDTKDFESRIKIGTQWSKTLYQWTGSTITVTATASEELILEVSAPNEATYPVSFPLELKGETTPPDINYTTWDGTPISATINTPEDKLYYSYTHPESAGKVMFYLLCTHGSVDAQFDITVADEPVEATDYDNTRGGYAQFVMWPGDVLKFSVQSTKLEYGSYSPRTLVIKKEMIALVGNQQPGYNFENAIVTNYDTKFTVPVNLRTGETSGIDESLQNLSWLEFTPTASGIANLDTELYNIFVIKESDFGSTTVNPRQIIQDQNNNNHLFTVEANQKYYIAVPNPRPVSATLKFTAVEFGRDCQLPFEFTGSSTMSIINGETWYKYSFGDKKLLEITSSANWEGTIKLIKFCGDKNPITITKKSGEQLLYISPIEEDSYRPYFLIGITSNADIDGAITVTERNAIEGEICELSTPVTLGENSFGGINRHYFMAYTATKDCMIELNLTNGIFNRVGISCGFTSIAIESEIKAVIRAEKDQTYYIDVISSTNQSVLAISENEVPIGKYCDYPIPADTSKDIPLGNVPQGTFSSKFFSFTESQSGIRVFSSLNAEMIADQGWTLIIRNECEGQQTSVIKTFGEDDGEPIYTLAVEAGKTYLAEIVQYPSKNELVLIPSFRTFQSGETCGTPISTTLGQENIIKYTKLSTWYEVDATTAGFYTISGTVGQGGGIYVKRTCNGTKETMPFSSDSEAYANGIKLGKIYVDTPSKFYVETLIESSDATAQYSVKIEFSGEAALGDVCSKPIMLEPNTAYAYTAGKGAWFKYTINPNEKAEFRTIGAFVSAVFYTACEGNQISVKEELTSPEWGYKYTLEPVSTPTDFHIYLQSNFGCDLKVITDRPTSIDNITVASSKVYPNPSNGVITIKVADVANNATAVIRNIVGAQVAAFALTSSETTFDLGNIATGNYIVTVTNGTNVTSHRLIIK